MKPRLAGAAADRLVSATAAPDDRRAERIEAILERARASRATREEQK